MTSISVALGPKGLLQLGVSLTDVALLISIGQKIGNFFQVSNNEQSLLDALGEDIEALIKRRGIIEPTRMQSRWAHLGFIYRRRKQT